MSTVIIITPPTKPNADRSEITKAEWDKQLKKDLMILEAAGFKVQLYQTENRHERSHEVPDLRTG